MMKNILPSVNDEEGLTCPQGLPPVIDAHVHVFPDEIFSAIQKWFDEHAWTIRYRMSTPRIFDFLLSRGVNHIIALQYAHKPGIARQLNQYLIETCRAYDGKVTGLATVFPGEDNAEHILREAFDAGLGGLKLHAHVQCFEMNSDAMNRLYECCRINKKPLVMHVGREPKSPAYKCDPYELCHVEKLETVLKDFPDLKVCVPHLGFDEVRAYRHLIESHDNLWLDTTMAITDYFPMKEAVDLQNYRPDRIMYGSDFPNIPYAWDRELKVLAASHLPYDSLEKICSRNACDFFNLE